MACSACGVGLLPERPAKVTVGSMQPSESLDALRSLQRLLRSMRQTWSSEKVDSALPHCLPLVRSTGLGPVLQPDPVILRLCRRARKTSYGPQWLALLKGTCHFSSLGMFEGFIAS